MIIARPNAGICNRIRVIKSCIELHRKTFGKQNIKIVWEKNIFLNSNFDDIFQPIKDVEILHGHPVLSYFNNYQDNNTLPYRSRIKKFLLKPAFANYKYFNNETIIPFKFKNAYWENLKHKIALNIDTEFYDAEIPNIYHEFKPVIHLQKKIDREVYKLIKPSIGVHIRRTDHQPSVEKSSDGLFIKKIHELLNAENSLLFFLATDDPKVETILRNEFGSHIITQTDKIFERESKEGIDDAIIDLYALSNTKYILGSYGSSFSRIAAKINNIPLEVIQ